MRTLTLTALLAFASPGAPAFAQVVSTHPPLSPAEAVRVLRGSHSLADFTDVHFSPADGPRIFVMGGSPTAGPYGEFRPFAPTRRLSRDSYMLYDGRLPWYGGGPRDQQSRRRHDPGSTRDDRRSR